MKNPKYDEKSYEKIKRTFENINEAIQLKWDLLFTQIKNKDYLYLIPFLFTDYPFIRFTDKYFI